MRWAYDLADGEHQLVSVSGDGKMLWWSLRAIERDLQQVSPSRAAAAAFFIFCFLSFPTRARRAGGAVASARAAAENDRAVRGGGGRIQRSRGVR